MPDDKTTTSPTTDQPELLPVIQADREAAMQAVPDDGSHSSYMMVDAINEGRGDDWPLVQAFARHRLTFTTPTFGDMVMVPADLRRLSDRATSGPWSWEQCGEKEDVPVVGIAFAGDDPDCKAPYEGEFRDSDANRMTIAYDWQSCDGHSPSSNAAFAVAAVNFVRSMIAAAPASPIPTSVNGAGSREALLLSFVLQCAAGNPAAIGSQCKATALLERLGIEGRDGYFFHTEEADLADARNRLSPIILTDGARKRLLGEFRTLHEAARGCEFDLSPADGAIARLTLFVHQHGDEMLNALSPALDNIAVEVERLREALAAEDDYWAASRAHASALPRLRESTGAVFAAATARRDAARAALAETEKAR